MLTIRRLSALTILLCLIASLPDGAAVAKKQRKCIDANSRKVRVVPGGGPGGFSVSVTRARCSRDAQCCAGLVCNKTNGRCRPGCRIDKAVFEDGDVDPANSCQSCQPDVDRAGWSPLPAGILCGGAPSGACDAQNTCDGQGRCTESYEGPSVVCRESAGDCDVAERCTGSSPDCPADGFDSSATVCRQSAGECDVAERCTGSSPDCPPDGFRSSDTVCRSSAGDCDVAERCTGSSAACPADQVKSSGAVCRESGGVCDVAERCTGSSPACPADVFLPSDTVCRSSAGDCDVVERCTGSYAGCPQDAVAPPNLICRAAQGVCDVAEACTGSSPACPPDSKSTATCRSAAGVCDVAESCDGVGDDCPADGFAASTVVCRQQGQSKLCDAPETCTGTGPDCPANEVYPSGTECRAAASNCDVDEVCDGTSDVCPADVVKPSGTVCRLFTGQCDKTEACDGASNLCPPDQKWPSGTQCRGKAGPCDVAETCDGTHDGCPADQFVPSTVECRPAVDPTCDVADHCTGASAACPTDAVAPADTVCHTPDPSNVCDDVILCAGANTCPPPFVDESRVCRAASTQPLEFCDVPEFCQADAQHPFGFCPADAIKPKGALCLRTPDDYCQADVTCNGISKRCDVTQLEPDGTACVDLATHVKPGVCRTGNCVLMGSRCTFGSQTNECGIGQTCINCAAENAPAEGYCADAARPCCSAGAFVNDVFWCGDSVLGDGSVATQQCCNWKCFHLDDDQHCNGCNTNCVGKGVGPPGANPCLFQPYSAKCESTFGDPVCVGDADYLPNQVCHADGSIWTYSECSTDADCPSGSECGGPAHDDVFQSHSATYGLCILPLDLQPDVPCVVDSQCPNGTDAAGQPVAMGCYSVTTTDPNTFVLGNSSFCKPGRRCATSADCACPSGVGCFATACINGFCGVTPEGTFTNVELCAPSGCAGDIGSVCTTNADCDSGFCAPGCGISEGQLSFIGFCVEANICAP